MKQRAQGLHLALLRGRLLRSSQAPNRGTLGWSLHLTRSLYEDGAQLVECAQTIPSDQDNPDHRKPRTRRRALVELGRAAAARENAAESESLVLAARHAARPFAGSAPNCSICERPGRGVALAGVSWTTSRTRVLQRLGGLNGVRNAGEEGLGTIARPEEAPLAIRKVGTAPYLAIECAGKAHRAVSRRR
jgi:hypothetical protein